MTAKWCPGPQKRGQSLAMRCFGAMRLAWVTCFDIFRNGSNCLENGKGEKQWMQEEKGERSGRMQNPKASHQDSAEMAITIIMIINNNKKMNPQGKGFHSQSVSRNKRRQSCHSGWAISKLDTSSAPTYCHFFKLGFLKKRCIWILLAKEHELTVWIKSTDMNHGAPHKRY